MARGPKVVSQNVGKDQRAMKITFPFTKDSVFEGRC